MTKHNKQNNKTPQKKDNKLMIGVGIGSVAAILLIIGIIFFASKASSTSNGGAFKTTSNGIQQISMKVTGSAYQPAVLTVQAGKPVRWMVDGTKATGCTTYLISPQLGVSKRLSSGENVIEFTAPTQKGAYGFQCSMGMVRGTMNVI